MRPTVFEMLESIEHNLSTYVEPELSSKLALSGAQSMRYLLRQVAARVAREPALLFEDNEDKRLLFVTLVPLLRKSELPDLSAMADDLEAALDRSGRHGGFPTLTALTEEGDVLREQLDGLVRVLGQHAEQCDASLYAEIDGLVSAQLLRQGDRDAQCFDSTYSGRMF